MKKKYIIANWKMYLSYDESVELAYNLAKSNISIPEGIEVVVCPAMVSLGRTADILKDTGFNLGAQDCSWENEGSLTGETRPSDIRTLQGKYVIVGHSSRRESLGETDEMINKKIIKVLESRLIPVLCIGETGAEKEAHKTEDRIIQQLDNGLSNIKLKEDQQIIIAYEPLWAIYPASLEVDPHDIANISQLIERHLLSVLGKDGWLIVYGGSVDSHNIKNYLDLELTQGVLVGHASADENKFVDIIKNIIS